jgi:glycosyltransferase involved in cell wall biosynthesis
MQEPLVSIGLQFYNNEKTLRLAIRSILNQSFQDWELILHDDGSTDASLAIAQGFATDPRLRIYTEVINRRRPYRLNASIDLARGKYYAIMDADDVAYPERLTRQVEYLESHPKVDAVGAQILIFDGVEKAIGRRFYPLAHRDICATPYAGFPLGHVTMMGKTDWFKQYYYDERTRGLGEDQDLMLRAHQYSHFANLPDILMGVCEPRLNLKKTLTQRYYFMQSRIRYYYQLRDGASLVRAVLGQCARAGLDVVAISSGLGYRLLRHRARPITEEERQEWMRVWNSLQ